MTAVNYLINRCVNTSTPLAFSGLSSQKREVKYQKNRVWGKHTKSFVHSASFSSLSSRPCAIFTWIICTRCDETETKWRLLHLNQAVKSARQLATSLKKRKKDHVIEFDASYWLACKERFPDFLDL